MIKSIWYNEENEYRHCEYCEFQTDWIISPWADWQLPDSKVFSFGLENAHCISQLTCQQDYHRKIGYPRKS